MVESFTNTLNNKNQKEEKKNTTKSLIILEVEETYENLRYFKLEILM